ncbi:hypothetical protein GGR96_000281 [Thalassospira tepidiphila]|uniref:Uncharacterized protein n=1 Tax=Thalassospira tepidiphila TaxID=393657 RepID=A0ABX0WV61_9PROT|nr:hypothetical protein [Thalassospira tepidiphila]
MVRGCRFLICKTARRFCTAEFMYLQAVELKNGGAGMHRHFVYLTIIGSGSELSENSG